MADLGGLSGLGMYGGYLQAEGLGADVNKKKYENQIQQAGDAAFGRTLMALNQQQPQGPPPPQMQGPMGGGMPPGGPPPVSGMPQGAGPQAQPTMQMAPGMSPGGPPLPQPRPPQAPPPVPMPPQQPMGGQPQPPMGGPPMAPQGGGMPMPPQAGLPQGVPSQQAGMPGGGPQQPALDWRIVLQKVQQANPGAPPQVVAAAVDRFLPLMNSQSQMQWREERLAMQTQMNAERLQNAYNIAAMRVGAAGARQEGRDSEQKERVGQIVDGLASGNIPPTLTGMYRDKAVIEAEAQKRGLNLSQMQVEWSRAQKQIMSLNGPQATRFYGLANSVQNTIGEVKQLADQLELSGITPLNRVKLESLISLRGNTPEGQLATRYVTALNTLKEEFANLAQGGYAPTESVWALANKQINENYGVDQLNSSLEEINRLIGYRVQGLQSIGGGNIGPNAPNRYTGGGQQQPAAPAAAGGAAGEANTVKLKPLDDAGRKYARRLLNEGFTKDQAVQQLRKKGYDPESE